MFSFCQLRVANRIDNVGVVETNCFFYISFQRLHWKPNRRIKSEGQINVKSLCAHIGEPGTAVWITKDHSRSWLCFQPCCSLFPLVPTPIVALEARQFLWTPLKIKEKNQTWQTQNETLATEYMSYLDTVAHVYDTWWCCGSAQTHQHRDVNRWVASHRKSEQKREYKRNPHLIT